MSTALPVEVELRGPRWRPAVAVDEAIATALAELATSLGLDVTPEVDVRVVEKPGGLPLALRVAGSPVRYSALLPRDVELLEGAGDPATFAALVCRYACALHAGVLAGPAQAAEYAVRLRRHGVEVPGDDWLRTILAGVLDVGIAVRDLPAVVEVLTAREDDHGPAVREALISRLAPDELRLLVPDEVAAGLTAIDPVLESDLPTILVTHLSQETGIALPPLRTAGPAGLPPDTFALQVNDVALLPVPLPVDGTLVVDGSADLVQLLYPSAEATPTTLPGLQREVCAVPAEHAAGLDSAGFTTWDSKGQLTVVVAARLRERAGWCVHQDQLQAQLDTMQAVTPRTVLAARTACPPWQLAVLVRALASDRVPLTDLPGLLERLIEVPYLEDGEARLALLGDPVTAVGAYPPAAGRDQRLESFVRTGLRDTIAQFRPAGADALDVVLLDEAVEERLRADRPEADEALLDSVADWLDDRAGTIDHPVLLVADDVRGRVAGVLRPVHPALRVAAYGDLPAELLVIPEGRTTESEQP